MLSVLFAVLVAGVDAHLPDYGDGTAAHGPGTSFTLLLPPATAECFYQNVEPEQTLDVEFQVTKGGNLDIDYFVRDPKETTVVAKSRITNSWDIHTGVYVAVSGDYEICFSNKFSRVSSKLVFISIAVASPMEEGGGMMLDEKTTEEFQEISVSVVLRLSVSFGVWVHAYLI